MTDGGTWTAGRRARSAGAVVGAAGLGWMLVAGLRADDYWGFFIADPPCIAAGTCTWEDLGSHQQEAWASLVPGAVVAGLGGAVVLAAAIRSGGMLAAVRRLGALQLAVRAVPVIVGVGAVAALPVFLAAAIAPPLGAALLAVSFAVLVLVLAAVLRAGSS